MTREEMETHINFDRAGDTARVYSADAVMMRRLDDLCQTRPEITVLKQDQYSKTYVCPKSWVKIRAPRQLTDEQREKQAQRARENLAGRRAEKEAHP